VPFSSALLRRAAGLPPKTLARIAARKLRFRIDARRLPRLAEALTEARLLHRLGAASVDDGLGILLHDPPFPRPARVPDDAASGVLDRAAAVHARTVDLLGSGATSLGTPIDWTTDFKSGLSWPMAPMDTVAVNRLSEPCDIKVVWDLSRLQWLMPAAQAWRIAGDDAHAETVRTVIDEWIAANPIARGPNWVCAMDVGLRGVSLVWLAAQCLDAPSWADPGFRLRLLKTLWLHGLFVSRHLEWSDVNGNHLLADALGLVIIGAALPGPDAAAWQRDGWALMTTELGRQVTADGGSFEVSAAYHRFVLEMAIVAVSVRRASGQAVDPATTDTLIRMADFLSAAMRLDGSVPNWGDADDGRVLPVGADPVGDFAAVARTAYRLGGSPSHPPAPAAPDFGFWLTGEEDEATADTTPASRLFAATGAAILRGGRDHVFADVGPVGMAGRGGHGHNDCLSFEAVLDGVALIVDPGTGVYTADPPLRNRLRATAAHNTPVIDGEEINRMVAPDLLWILRDDATPSIEGFDGGPDAPFVTASHDGYARLADPVTVRRTLRLDPQRHVLTIDDRIEARGRHTATVRLTFDSAVRIADHRRAGVDLTADGRSFRLTWTDDAWRASIEDAVVSPSYGVVKPAQAVTLTCEMSGPAALTLILGPAEAVAQSTRSP
jgi:uncharacterized heparinase superfamily protein